MRDEFYFPSKDGNTEIHTIEWKPVGEVRAVLQICHGMVEYIRRYDEFAQFLCGEGYYVVGNDHLGHGKSIQAKSEYGFFNEKYGNACVLGDMHTLRQRTEKKYPGVPYFMLGHSMGSSLLRQYIQMYGNGLSGAVLMGTVADHKKAALLFGKRLCRVMAAFRGWHYRSKMVDNLVLGAYNKKFKPARTRADWITSDNENLDMYVADPLCSFMSTVNAYYNVFSGMIGIQRKESVYMIPKGLPVLFVSGADDPVGEFGKGVRKIYEKYRAAGIRDVTLRLYTGDRHEILNETDRDQVYKDLLGWFEKHI
ncbi:alpha/beta fold hydrolase [[Ruminococcus] torques]|jgi:alpha-beta hydrolase superfamily lysophospholipase|uniref:alpha/beta fold hydrolase n=1 Tax=[Ruminococcus] torques TaxID=33039 RepID=UPI001F9D7E45|nr:alpha/beta hydrolase [[Ruminococcus] torques]MBS5398412.1 alpha/beta hydrolase [Lachnospiraceae bacterium]MDM8235565.1 alpha/beta hydrolase [[Ruminococcus] torques]HJC80330.1 alpha/beta hydrolase [Candidatus Mediterraneibacter excrementipullorum]